MKNVNKSKTEINENGLIRQRDDIFDCSESMLTTSCNEWHVVYTEDESHSAHSTHLFKNKYNIVNLLKSRTFLFDCSKRIGSVYLINCNINEVYYSANIILRGFPKTDSLIARVSVGPEINFFSTIEDIFKNVNQISSSSIRYCNTVLLPSYIDRTTLYIQRASDMVLKVNGIISVKNKDNSEEKDVY